MGGLLCTSSNDESRSDLKPKVDRKTSDIYQREIHKSIISKYLTNKRVDDQLGNKVFDHYFDQEWLYRRMISSNHRFKRNHSTGSYELLAGYYVDIYFREVIWYQPDLLANNLSYFDEFTHRTIARSVRGDFGYQADPDQDQEPGPTPDLLSLTVIRQIHYLDFQGKPRTFYWSISNIGPTIQALVIHNNKFAKMSTVYFVANKCQYRYCTDTRRALIYLTDRCVFLGELSGCYSLDNTYQLPETDIILVPGVPIGRWKLRSVIDKQLLWSCWTNEEEQPIDKCLISVGLNKYYLTLDTPILLSTHSSIYTDSSGRHFYASYFNEFGKRLSQEEYHHFHQGRYDILKYYLNSDLATLLDYI